MSNKPDPQASELVVSVKVINPDGTTSDHKGAWGISTRGGTGKAIQKGDGKPRKGR
jgi:hypothetical protein